MINPRIETYFPCEFKGFKGVTIFEQIVISQAASIRRVKPFHSSEDVAKIAIEDANAIIKELRNYNGGI